ncbi:cytochrome bc complex cytochrome b subunit [Nocardioides zeae]|uniref:Cytochrome bc1 complex cytochrome b subunit n=1 Tax=Nocardioides imazamoxiresistens TaxID=3231893 RepID=A0ABU3PX50_9ACTN|nr:cytochrome bc complex cytochrome b subunit [Nocardioides zeae]MDT9593810.1 cytochrome bc complex cytochrome b subunit [Nocardioides zeae]
MSTTSKVASTNGTSAAGGAKPSKVGAGANWADERLGLAALGKKNLRKVFPDHWSFMLGEIALWSFVVLLLTGVFLTFWFNPSMTEIEYQGSYAPLRGSYISEAFNSSLHISFDVRGGLLLRQMHHWAAHLFIGAMLIHMMRVFLTGAYRKPRELNWVIGVLLLTLGTLEGFTGYSLPDDLLSGTGVRAADGFVKSIPVIGTYGSFLLFGDEFPGHSIIPRLYIIHVLLIPALLLGLIAAHMLLLVYHKHTQWPGPGRTEKNVVGFPMLPVYAAKAGGFFFIVFGVTALMGGVMTINPIWMYGPYDPTKVTAGSQPDWYMGWPDGLLRIIPGWTELSFWGVTFALPVFLTVIMVPTLIIILLILLPFIENWISGDKREHHLLQRPRDTPARTGVMAALVTFYGLALIAGGNDIIAIRLDLSINQITYFLRGAIFLGPILAFWIAKRWCISLQRHAREQALHGYETGIIERSPEGAFSERHLPLPAGKQYVITQREPDSMPVVEAQYDENGVRKPGGRLDGLRGRLAKWYFADNVQPPTAAELEEAHHHHGGHDDHAIESSSHDDAAISGSSKH